MSTISFGGITHGEYGRNPKGRTSGFLKKEIKIHLSKIGRQNSFYSYDDHEKELKEVKLQRKIIQNQLNELLNVPKIGPLTKTIYAEWGCVERKIMEEQISSKIIMLQNLLGQVHDYILCIGNI